VENLKNNFLGPPLARTHVNLVHTKRKPYLAPTCNVGSLCDRVISEPAASMSVTSSGQTLAPRITLQGVAPYLTILDRLVPWIGTQCGKEFGVLSSNILCVRSL
jgi:hypothetical protein